MAAAQVNITLSRPQLFKDLQDGHRRLDDLLLPLGVAGFAGMANRLVESYSTDDNAARTGNMLRSMQVFGGGQGGTQHTINDLTPTSITIGSSVEYAAMQDEGGTIRPRTVKALAIPIPRALRVQKKWPRDFAEDELDFIPNRFGGRTVGWLINKSGSLGFGRGVLFTLVRFVTLKAKHMTAAGQARIEEELPFIYEDWINGMTEAA